MNYDPHSHHRRSTRLQGYDYAQAGAYFVTICTKNRECLLGTIVNETMHLSAAGQTVASVWNELPERFPSVGLDVFVVMPNHVHAVILVGAQFIAPQFIVPDNRGVMNPSPALGDIVRTFKAVSTRVIRGHAFSSFAWQRNYYDHIIRDDEELRNVREYIVNNPARWAFDRENPAVWA